MKILGFAASTSKASINKKLVSYAASLISDSDVEIIDLNDFELPLFSVDKEKDLGVPVAAERFLTLIQSADKVIISFAEHNGSYSAAYKNIFDWASRIGPKVYAEKDMVLLSTSPGGRGGASVLASAETSIPRFGGNVVGTLSLPSFNDNFDTDKNCISNAELDNKLKVIMSLL